MMRETPIGLGAGLAAAALVLAQVGGSMMGVFLELFAALPITLVTLGWGYRAGLVASISAMVMLAAVLGIPVGLSFGVTFALPAWGLAYLAIADGSRSDDGRGRISLGTLVVVAACLSAASTLFATLALGTSYLEIMNNLEQILSDVARGAFGIPKDQPIVIPDVQDPAAAIRLFSRFLLPASAFIFTILSVCGLWLSGRIARISGRLPRPWPDVAALRLPRWALALLVVSGLLSILPDIYGFVGQLLLMAVVGAFTIQGFAVLHFVTRGVAARPLLIASVYLLCLVMSWIAIGVIAIVGILDLLFDLRRRSGSGGRPHLPKKPM